MILLAETPTEVTPGMMGVVVIILLQLAQFFFAYRASIRAGDAEWKTDISAMRTDLRTEIKAVKGELDDFSKSVEKKMETARVESSRARKEIYDKIETTGLKAAALHEGQETIKQTLISLGTKVDLIRATNNPPATRRS